VSKFEDIDNDRLIYTCNCGWVDLGHANPHRTTRPHIGAITLWEDIQKETGTRSEYDDGFLVEYTQDMRKSVFSASESGFYFVKSKLPLDKKKAIALAIFREVSIKFETMQGDFPYGIFSGDSSFSQEDLVSNVIGFYRAIYPDKDFLKLCQPVSKEASKVVWNTSGSVGSEKKRDFKPLYHNCKDCPNPPVFPKELQEIKPAAKEPQANPPKKGVDFRDWAFLHDEKTAMAAMGIREGSRLPKF
jgi:hypothetical protein